MVDDQSPSPGGPDDDKKPAGADPDATRPTPMGPMRLGPVPRGSEASDPDATRPIPGSTGDSATAHAIRPPTPDPTAEFKTQPATWRGSATPRAGEPAADRTATWSPEPPSGRRAWWLPIVAAIVGLLVLVAVAYALVHALNTNSPAQPVITPTPTASTSPVTPSTVPSPPPSPSASPSVSPSVVTPSSPATSASTRVIPSTLTGLLFPDADAELNALGLKYQLVAQIDDDPSVIPNTVLFIDPTAGTTVAVGSVVKVIYAARSASTSSTTPTA